MNRRAKADALRAMHHEPALLVLVNAWDAVSARTIASAPGCRALATASWSIAAARGVEDGERLSREEMIAAVATVAGAVGVPVSADLEAGYGATPAEVAATIEAAIAAGAVGCNLEDGDDDGADPLRPAAEHAERVAAAREAGARAGVPLVINARTDVFLRGVGDPADRVEHALQRGRAYAEAGGDCIFVPGATDPGDLRRLVAGMGVPVSVLALPGGPSPAELHELGVARMSLGPGSLGIAMAALHAAAAGLYAGGPLPDAIAFEP
jgi:2-methylisocitrate lyase-like PEP mutase family enzyme